MPNRFIKESICTSDNLNNLSAEAEVFFYRLMVQCDDFGIMHATPSILRAKCYPLRLDKVKDRDIEKYLNELCKQNLIFIYEYAGRKYLKYTTWLNHQQKRASKSKYPTPDMEGVTLISNDIKNNQKISNVPVFENEFDNDIRKRTSKKDVDNFFEIIWKLYPRKEGKGSISDKQKETLYEIGLEEMTRAINRYKQKLKNENIEKKYIKQGSTFLNSGYVDYLDKNYEETQKPDNSDIKAKADKEALALLEEEKKIQGNPENVRKMHELMKGIGGG